MFNIRCKCLPQGIVEALEEYVCLCCDNLLHSRLASYMCSSTGSNHGRKNTSLVIDIGCTRIRLPCMWVSKWEAEVGHKALWFMIGQVH